jgi:peptide/nickel transport system substrate-binding protein
VGAAASPVAASAGGAPAAPADKQVLRLITANMPRSLDPVNIDAQRIIENGLAEPVVRQKLDGSIAPGLAQSWKLIEPTLIEIELPANATFWSGAKADAAAVKASFERHARLNPRVKSVLEKVEYQVVDPTHLRFKLPAPDPAFLFKLVTIGVHNAAQADAIGVKFNTEPDLTGYFKPTQFTPGESLTAEAWPGYWGEKPKLQRIEAKLGADAQARELALKTNAADMDINVDVDQRKRYEEAKGFTFYPTNPGTRTIWLNIKAVPALQEVKVRQALSLALDRKEMQQGVFRGYAGLPTGHFPAGLPYALTTGPATDLQKANQLLDEAGWKPGADGTREKDGQKLSFRILTYSYLEATAIAAQSYWKKIGVATELQQVEITSSNQIMFDGKFEIATYCSCGAATGDVAGQLRAYYYSNVVSNYGRYSNPDVDNLIDQASGELDEAKRFDLAKQIQQKVADDVAVIYVANIEAFSTIYSNRIQGVNTDRARDIVPSMYVAQQ